MTHTIVTVDIRPNGRPPNAKWPGWIDLNTLRQTVDNPPDGWQQQAACTGQTDLFYPAGQTGSNHIQSLKARGICHTCPAIYPCLADALRSFHHNTDHGIWGGTVTEERRHLRRRMHITPRTRP